MARTKWTDEELEILARTAGNGGLENYHLFGRATNYSKSYDAWEVKRRRFLGGEAQKTAVEYAGGGAMPPAIGVTRDEVADYAGFRMAFFDIQASSRCVRTNLRAKSFARCPSISRKRA